MCVCVCVCVLVSSYIWYNFKQYYIYKRETLSLAWEFSIWCYMVVGQVRGDLYVYNIIHKIDQCTRN